MASHSGPYMTYMERFKNFVNSHVNYHIIMYTMINPIKTAIRNALGHDIDWDVRSGVIQIDWLFLFQQYAAQSSYYFVNTDEHLDYVQPITQKVIYIGGLRLKEPKPLSSEFDLIARKSVRGLVLISVGSDKFR